MSIEKQITKNVESILKEIKKTPDGGQIPREGASSFLYEHLSNPGEMITLKTKNAYHFLYIDHDDVIQEMDPASAKWTAEKDNGRFALTLLFMTADSPSSIIFTFHLDREESAALLSWIKKKKKVEITFLNILYGGIVRERSAVFPIPKNILKVI